MAYIKDIQAYLDTVAHRSLQESYDNAGLLTGNPEATVKGILTTLDCTEAVVDEAIEEGCNLIVAHHPIIFKGLKQLTGKNYVERTIIKAIKHDIGIYAIHTNLDNVHIGVNKHLSDILGLDSPKILAPKNDCLRKLVVFVPEESTRDFLKGLGEAGAGQIGEYKHCSFAVTGTGRFTPTAAANPHIGSAGKPEEVRENRVEVIFPDYLTSKIIAAMHHHHPYEEAAHFLHELENENQEVGAGMMGQLPEAMDERKFLQYVKEVLDLKVLKHTPLLDKPIQNVAVCGGAGSFLISKAKRKGADVLITSDVKYHEYFDADNELLLVDVGHYESESHTKVLLHALLREKFTNIAVHLSKINTNPTDYLI